MAKTKYYYTDDNGIERLARTSNNVYNFYCDGSCSKTYDGALKDRNREMKRLAEKIYVCERVLADKTIMAKRMALYKKSEEEIAKETKESIKRYEKEYEQHAMQKVYKLYTK